MTTTVPPLADSAQLARESRWRPLREVLMREPVLLGSTVAAIAVGWLLTVDLLYLAGLGLAVLWASIVPARRRVRALAIVTVLVLGLGGPCLAVRLSYRETGVAVTSDVDLTSVEYVTAGDGGVVVLGRGPDDGDSTFDVVLVAMSDSGEQVWTTPSGMRMYWPLDDGRLVALDGHAFRDIALIDTHGDEEWSHSLAPDQGGLVAMDGDVLVVQACAEGRCTWTGLDLADGRERWELIALPAPAWHLRDAERWDPNGAGFPFVSSLFVTASESGVTQLRDAGTGAVVGEVPQGATPVLARELAFALHRDGRCRVELVLGGEPWVTEIDCALVGQVPADAPPTALDELLTPAPPALGVLVGDAWWLVGDAWFATEFPPGAATVLDGAGTVLDITTGSSRTAPAATRRTFGAGVVVEHSGGGFTVRDPVDGARLWGAPLPDGSLVRSAGDLVVMAYRAPLLLGELFDPGARADTVVEVREARTGSVVARLRAGSRFAIADDRVFVDVGDEIRMVIAD